MGDTIGIVAPSLPVEPEMEARLTEGVAGLESMGFSVKLGEHIKSEALGYTRAPEHKAEGLNNFLRDLDIDAIFCA